MDFTLDVLLLKKELYKLNIKEFLFEWGGEKFSQDPPIYKDDTGLEFKEIQDLGYYTRCYKKYIEDDLNVNQYISLTLCGDYISDLEFLINKKNSNSNADIILKFLEKLFELSTFAVFLIRDEEEIDSRYRIKTKDEFLNVFCNCLKWESPEGALITKSN